MIQSNEDGIKAEVNVNAVLHCICGSYTFYFSDIESLSGQYIRALAVCVTCNKQFLQELRLTEVNG